MNKVKIRQIPTQWKYYCECNHEIQPWGYNYCPHCGKQLDWSAENIYVDCYYLKDGDRCARNFRDE